MLPALDHFDAHAASRFGQRAISRDQWRTQRFGKSQVGCVISRQTVPHLPNAGEQDEMWIAGDGKIDQIGESFGAPFSGDAGREHIPAQDLRHFEVDQMWGMQRRVGGEEQAAHAPSCSRLQKNLKDSRRINDDQRLFLSARTAAAGAGCGRTG
jgi:hypothetical protein